MTGNMNSKDRRRRNDRGRVRKRHSGNAEGKLNLHANDKVQLNGQYMADIVGLTSEGGGVAKVNGFTLFVPGLLPGEKALVKVTGLRAKYGFAQLVELVEASAERVSPPCAIYDQCGGCQLQHLSYEGQLVEKRQQVIDSLQRIGKFTVAGDMGDYVASKEQAGHDQERIEHDQEQVADDVRESGHNIVEHEVVVHPTLGMTDPWHYRNKAQLPVGQADGRLVTGFYARGSHRLIEMEHCLIQHDENDRAVNIVREIADELGISAYDEQAHRGLLRHIVVRHGFVTGETMVVLVTNGADIPKRDELVGLIREALPQVVSICQSINTKQTNVILGERAVVLWGEETIRDYIGDLQFQISAHSFYQVNPVQTKVLYEQAVAYAGLTGEEVVIDAYCGIGTIALFVAQHAGEVYGVEIVEEAIEDAKRNAYLNGITNVNFIAGRAEEVMPRWQRDGVEADVIIVDPPRKGCEPELLQTIIAMRPKRVVYVSCNPATLARDLRVLADGGYRVAEVQPVDMFPQSYHVEVVCYMNLDVAK